MERALVVFTELIFLGDGCAQLQEEPNGVLLLCGDVEADDLEQLLKRHAGYHGLGIVSVVALDNPLAVGKLDTGREHEPFRFWKCR